MMVPVKTEELPAGVFVLEIDGQPILALMAATLFQARETRPGAMAPRGLEANDARTQTALGWDVSD